MKPLPVNFETKLKEAKALNGGYPYSIKAEHLMKNFVDAKLEVDGTVHSSGLKLVEEVVWGDSGHPGRSVRISGTTTGAYRALHPFKITINEEDATLVDIAAGKVYHESGAISVSEQVGLTPSDVFLLKITRDGPTREVTEAESGTYSSSFAVTSSATYQYLKLGSYSDGQITQNWFHDASVFEDLAIVNGLIKLVPLAMVGPNFYNAP